MKKAAERLRAALARLLRRRPALDVAVFMPPPAYLDQTFVDAALDLTNRHVERCHFDGCVLRLEPGSAVIAHNTFKCCDLVGSGWPSEMVADARRLQR